MECVNLCTSLSNEVLKKVYSWTRVVGEVTEFEMLIEITSDIHMGKEQAGT